MTDSSVFLTGATGYSGQAVLTELTRRSIPVIALVRRSGALTGCEIVVGDLTEVDAFAARIRDASAVIHLASPRGESRELVARYDVLPTRRMLTAWCRGAFVYPSSATVYGVPGKAVLKEDAATAPTFWYDVGKLAIESDLQAAGTTGGGGRGPAVALRPALIFACNDRRADRQYFGWIYLMCQARRKFVFDSEEGLETYGASFIGAEDYGRAVADSLGLTTGGAYHVAGGFCTWRALISAFDRHLGRESRFVVRPGGQARGSDEARPAQSRTELDTSAFEQATRFASRQSMEELVERFVAEERRQSAF